MRLIKLRGKNSLHVKVDDEDFEELNKYKWYATPLGDRTPVYRYVSMSERHKYNGQSKILIHRVLTNTVNLGESIFIDHRDRDTLNNQKENLRISDSLTNSYNRGRQKNNLSSKYKGVTWDKVNMKWRAQIRANKKTIALQRFLSENEAAMAYNEAAVKHHGEFAFQNIIL